MFGHVHDLAFNPADDRVYVATHHGLFFLENNTPHPVGDSRQDTMGFTITGPDNDFLASGHPAPDEEGPTNLGLLRSTDAGRTWEEVSLGGQSDFHALTAVDERIYGLDSATGSIKRSDDGGSTWKDGAAIAARDLDVDPADPDRLLATTAEGLMVSTDAGTSFQPAAAQPPKALIVLDHLPPGEGGGELVGLDSTGVAWRFKAGAWSSSGMQQGVPEALTAVDQSTYLAAFNTQVYRSADAGKTWDLISAP